MPLACSVDLSNLSDTDLECGQCNVCQPISALVYPFDRDLRNSQELVQAIMDFVHAETDLICEETTEHRNPDIEVCNNSGDLVCRIESKYLEGKAFMRVGTILQDNMKPKETVVIDEPKFLSYLSCRDRDIDDGLEIPIFIVWQFNRPCEDIGGISFFQSLEELERIYIEKGDTRRYTRRTGTGDFIGGRRLGVIEKYHFSIKECRPIEELIDVLNDLS